MASFPIPKNPQDWVRDGCAIEEHSDEGAKRWPLVIWVDILNVPPDPYCESTPKHSWCDQYSIRDSLEGAQKDCAKFLKDMRKELKKVGR